MTLRKRHLATPSDATRCAVYTRVSTGRQADEGYSLPEQNRRALAYIGRCADWAHVGTYREEGVSGGQRDRPALSRLLRDLDGIDVVIVASLDRLGRSTKDLLDLCDRFDKSDVALVSLREQIDTSTPVGRLLRTVLFAVAEFERDIGKERTSAGIGSRARTSGKPWGSSAAYGYRKTTDGHWAPEPAEVAITERIFRERVEYGQSYNGIATAFSREGVPSRSGGDWTATMVRNVLLSQHVLGKFEHRGEWYDGQHPSIIDPATWEAAQAMARKGSKYAPGRGGRPTRHLFRNGMLRCGFCNEAMLPRTDGDVYVCRSNRAKKGAGSCPMPRVKREAVETVAVRLFERTFVDREATRKHVAAELGNRLSEVIAQAQRSEREAAEKKAQRARVERDYLHEDLSAANYERLSEQLDAELSASLDEHIRLTAHEQQIRDKINGLDSEVETLNRLAELRATVAEKIVTAEQRGGIDALRAAMVQTFDHAYLGVQRGTLYVAFDAMALFDGKVGTVAIPLAPSDPTMRTSGLSE